MERLLERLDGCLSDKKNRTPLLFSWVPTMELVLRSVLADIIRSTVSAPRGARREHMAGKRL